MERSIFGLSTKAKLCGNEERDTIISCDKTVAREREKNCHNLGKKKQKSCMRMRNRWFVFVCAMIEKKNCALHVLKKKGKNCGFEAKQRLQEEKERLC